MIYKYNNIVPKIHSSCFIAKSADIIGDVTILEKSSIWFNAVIRGDFNSIYIGKSVNIQDNCIIHVNEQDKPVKINDYVTVGHGAILHGCTIGEGCLVGMGSIIMDNVTIGEGTIIGAGSLITSGKEVPSGVLCMGRPAKVVRELTEKEKSQIKENAIKYQRESENYISQI